MPHIQNVDFYIYHINNALGENETRCLYLIGSVTVLLLL